jgi:hypothetical protein
MNGASERRQLIDRWMFEASVDDGLERLDDLHLDQIDSEWGSRDQWLDAGLEAFRMAVELRDAHHLDVAVVLGFSLNLPATYPFKERRDFEAAVDWSPPSLYLFRPGDQPWLKPGYAHIEPLDAQAVFGLSEPASAYYAEFESQASGETCRTIYIAG